MLTKSHKSICPQASRLWRFWQTRFELAAQSSYSLRMENHTGYDIYQVHASSVWDADWEGSLLGRRVLQDGTSFTITQIPLGRCDVGFVANPIHSPVAPSYNDSA